MSYYLLEQFLKIIALEIMVFVLVLKLFLMKSMY